MKKCFLIFVVVLFIAATLSCYAGEEEKLIQVKGVIHLNSDVSSGAYTPEKLAEMAGEAGVEAAFMTKNLRPRWEYGVFPFRGIVKRSEERDGLHSYGPEKYRKRLDVIDDSKPGMTVHMAAEVAPFYYWTGSPFSKEGITINDWDLQLLVMGLDGSDYREIPTISNRGFSRYSAKSVLMLWPFILIIFGMLFLKKKHPRFYLADPLCWVLILAGVIFALNNYPFKDVKYHQYGGRKIGPYQEVVDYVNDKGGMTFWSAPEAKIDQEARGPVWVSSPSAERHMKEVMGYTGFCAFYEGYRQIGGPGGIWDDVLVEYCEGLRKKPVWVIGEMAYHSREASGGKEIDEVQTVFLVPSNTRENVIRALRSGGMYSLRRTKEYELRLDSFTVKYGLEEQAGMGEELEAAGPVTVDFSVSWKGQLDDEIIVRLIRSGEVIAKFVVAQPGEFEYRDEAYKPGEKVYYRLDIRGEYPSMLFSNPIFVKFAQRRTEGII